MRIHLSKFATIRRQVGYRDGILLLAVFTAAVLAVLATRTALASHHAIGNDSVDCTWGCEIAWEDYTQYDDARSYGINQWDALGKVNITPDDGGSITDLEYSDYSDCATSAYDAYWKPRLVADIIAFNTCKMKNYNQDQKRRIGVHELGHGLGIADHPTNRTGTYWRDKAIMYYDPKSCPFNTYTTHDKGDYEALW
jgi:hypothetical protein